MKRFIAVLSGILVLPAFAEVAPVYYDEVIEYTEDALGDEIAVEEETVQPKSVVQRGTAARSVTTNSRTATSSPRSTANKARTTTSRVARTSATANRASTTASRASVRARGTQSTKPVTARVSTTGSVMSAPRSAHTYTTNVNANYIDGTAVLDDTNVQYNPSRVSTRLSGRGPSAAARLSSVVSSTTAPVVTEADVSSATSNLNAMAELTDHCKAQYAACMDNYCNVLDDNQSRCSCSKNVKNYEKTEAALTKATEDFQEVVQKIRYIGLTGPQIEALFAETEAELAMKENTDSSQLKSSLDAIKRKIVDVSTPSASAVQDVTSGLTLDLNGLLSADFSAGFDLNSLLGSTNKTNTTSVTNQRGEQLYKSATNRCKTAILNTCVAQGVDANVVTNAYDLEIDKQCVIYERALNDANKEMKNNVFNATNILQQARLLLAQNKNSYDLRGCVAAIDACMQDEYVCGADYELCLDPTGKYLANGEIVKGGTPGISGGQSKNTEALSQDNLNSWLSGGMYDLYSTWNYNDGKDKNAWGRGAKESLGGYVDEVLTKWGKDYAKITDADKSENLALFLLQKVGYIDSDDKVHGLCASAMKQCQDYTFETKKSKKTFVADNEVVRQYLSSVLPKIKVQQDSVLSTYTEGCRGDVQSCLSTNGFDESNTKSTTSVTAINACAAEIKTCMSVAGYTPKDGTTLTLRAMRDWVASILTSCPADYYLVDDGIGDGTNLAASNTTGTAIVCKPCPAHSTSTGGQSTTCTCNEGYTDYYESGAERTGKNLQCISTDLVAAGGCAQNQYLKDGVCTACPTVNIRGVSGNIWSYVSNGSGTLLTAQTTSSGGNATSCECPSIYNTAYGTVEGVTMTPSSEETPDYILCYKTGW